MPYFPVQPGTLRFSWQLKSSQITIQLFFGMVLIIESNCVSVSLDLDESVLNLWGMYITIKNIEHTVRISRTHAILGPTQSDLSMW